MILNTPCKNDGKRKNVECRSHFYCYAECRYAECHYACCRGTCEASFYNLQKGYV